MECKKCGSPLSGKQTSYCSERCSRRHLKSLWQMRKKDVVNKAKAEWRKKTNRTSDKAWQERNAEKHLAHKMVLKAVKNGELKKEPCEECGSKNSQAHHDDYSKPLDVRWLCPKHHTEHHIKKASVLEA